MKSRLLNLAEIPAIVLVVAFLSILIFRRPVRYFMSAVEEEQVRRAVIAHQMALEADSAGSSR